ncbi:MAG TPA: nicotinate-nucleotide--dimethylbenzimidazole phosphoribosyltransferase [Porphyromonadaceae bacterium]|nr:nicotinate-nucleotide--dimethylbenzimidazole phosphoribosyltransferase [Porphyromonadaceae bacterium]
MKHFQIYLPDEKIKEELQDKIDNLTKPKGSLGRLEELALQAGLIQQTLSPVLTKPHNVIFAADHGVTEENVSVSPKEVTWQQCIHFLKSYGGGINFLCRQHGFTLRVVDAGVDYDFPSDTGIIDMKVRKGTRNYVHGEAMTTVEMELCIDRGAAVVRDINRTGCNIISFGEMGIGNTSASSLWMTCLTNIPLLQCVGAGAGLDNDGIRHKYQVLKRALDHYHGNRSAQEVMHYFGGYEMVMAVGAMLQAAELNMMILVDGFIMTNCLLAASRLYPEILSYAVFGHCSDETGHRLLLEALNARPLLNLGMRLGEGTGAICAYPILDSAVRMINEMNSFKGGKVTKYF